MPEPREPTPEEVQEHFISHIPPADWCPCCARAKALAVAHRRIRNEDKGTVPIVSMDLCFLRRRKQATMMPVAVVRENLLGETRAHGLLNKQVSIDQNSHVVNSIVGDI